MNEKYKDMPKYMWLLIRGRKRLHLHMIKMQARTLKTINPLFKISSQYIYELLLSR